MILFPNAKINLGLDILRRRPDGYHDIATVMIPVAWTDILEVVPARGSSTTLTVTGRSVDCLPEKNLVMKAYRALEKHLGSIPPVDIALHKVIPDGAGLGGGSADAAFALTAFNEVLSLGIEKRILAEIAATVGADCPFFIYNEPAYCTGTGTTLDHSVHPAIEGYTIAIAKPAAEAVNTAEAYAGVKPSEPHVAIPEILNLPIESWKESLKNDFETSIFPIRPQIASLKAHFFKSGALYAAMSGSGAAVFGIFDSAILAENSLLPLSDCDTWCSSRAAR